MTSRTDEQLMQGYQEGDYDAFAELYERYSGRVYGYLRKRISEPAQRDEVFQTVFLKLHKSRHRYNPQYPFAPWLFTLCRTTAIDAARSRNLFSQAKELDPETPEPAKEETRDLNLETVPPSQKQLLDWRYGDEMTFEEISKRLGISEVAVRKRLSRTLKELKARLTGKQ